MQLEANLGAAMVANLGAAMVALQTGVAAGVDATEVEAVFTTGVHEVNSDAAVKRAGLETELVAADAALSEAIDATVALAEVRQGHAA